MNSRCRVGLIVGILVSFTMSEAQGQPVRKFVETVRIGTNPDDTTYREPSLVTVLPNGGVVVAFTGRTETFLNVYDRQGNFVRRIGRSGGGPGEFHSIWSLGVLGESIWVGDGLLMRLTFFDQNGAVLRTVQVSGKGYPFPLTDGTYAVVPILPYVGDDPRNWPNIMRKAGPPKPATILHANEKGDSIGAFEVGQFRPRVRDHAVNKGEFSAGPQPWDDALLVRGYPDGSGVIAVERTVDTNNPRFTVTRYEGQGPLVFRSVIKYKPMPVTQADIDSVDAVIDHRERVQPPTGPARDASMRRRQSMRQSLWVPPHMTPVSAVVSGASGTAWIGRNAENGFRSWQLIDAVGKEQYQVKLNPLARVVAGDATHLWYTFEDDEGRVILVGGTIP